MTYEIVYKGSIIATDPDIHRALTIVEALLEDSDGDEAVSVRRRER